MTDLVPLTGSTGVKNPKLALFTTPPTDISISSYRMVPIQTFTTGINPVDFQVDPQEDYIDLNRSYFEVELALKKRADGSNYTAADNVFPVNNLAHTLFKQINVKLNGTLISPQTDTYHYKAYLELLLNHDRDDGETILKPQGWYNGIDCPRVLTANKLDDATPHDDFTRLSATQQETVKALKAERAKYVGGARHVLRFKPNIEVFHMDKVLVPGVQLQIQMYFNSPDLFMVGVAGGAAARLTSEDVKVRLYLCQLRLNPSVYLELEKKQRVTRKPVSYTTVRGEVRTFNMQGNQQRFEINNLFQGRIPNRVIVGMVLTEAFTGALVQNPFNFGKFGLSSIRQLVRGEEYPYETLELVHDNSTKDLRGYFRYLQATGCFCRQKGNMVRSDEWGQGKNCTLFVFDNAANGCLDSPVLNPKQSGEVQLILNFGAAPGTNLTIVVYGEFENLLEVDANKAVIYNVYER